jgi:hypothetical protein
LNNGAFIKQGFKFIKKLEIVSFKMGCWRIPVQISSVKLYLGAVIWDHQVKIRAYLIWVLNNVACEYVGLVSARRTCLSVLPMQSVICLISSASSNKVQLIVMYM